MDFISVRERSEYIALIRNYFVERGYLEVDTPILTPAVIPENSINLFMTKYINPVNLTERNYFLIPSPEIWMKKLLSEGSGNIFQITKSFRNGEQKGRLHNPEFTMLEWYTVNADYMDSINITENLFRYILIKRHRNLSLIYRNIQIDLSSPFLRLSMKEAFKIFAGINLDLLTDLSNGNKQINHIFKEKKLNISKAKINNLSWEAKFNILFLTFVEPFLPKKKPVVLYDYPSRIPTLAKTSKDSRYSERWELYMANIEIANCYSEENNREKITAYFKHEEQNGKKDYPQRRTDWSFPSIFKNNFPKCSGVALGIDRLLMLFFNKNSIDGVISHLFL